MTSHALKLKSAREYYHTGRHLARDGRKKSALRAFVKALSLNPGLFEAYYAMGELCLSLKNYKRANQFYRRCIQLNSIHGPAYKRLGVVYFLAGQFGKSIDSFICAQSLLPGDMDIQKNLRQIFTLQGKWDEALKCSKKILHHNNDDALCWEKTAEILVKLNDLTGAIEAYTKSLEIEPDAERFKLCADVLRQKGELVKAEYYYRKSLCMDSSVSTLPDALAQLLLEQNRCRESQTVLLSALKRGINNPRIHLILGKVYRKLHRFEDAENSFRESLMQDFHSPETHIELGDTCLITGKLNQALLSYVNCLKFEPGHPYATHMMNCLGTTGMKTEPPGGCMTYLFDKLSHGYDREFGSGSIYPSAGMLRNLLSRYLPPGGKFQEALDLGCGTGLFGEKIRDMVDNLTGVDISGKMLEQAKNKEIYDRLHPSGIVTFLSRDNNEYDLICAHNVFSHSGTLDEILYLCAQRCTKGSLVAFTVDNNINDRSIGFKAGINGRYSCGSPYIRQLSKHTDFEILRLQIVPLCRKVDITQSDTTHLCILQKS